MRTDPHGLHLRSERIVCPGQTIAGEVVVSRGRIAAVGPVGSGGDGFEVVELGDSWLVPGFIDCHVHGGGGAQCNTADPDEVAAVARFHAEHGTTGLVATTVAASVDELCVSLDAIARCAESPAGATVLGAHLEGPFLSGVRPGAMDPETFLAPDLAVLSELLAAGHGRVLVMTVAPELPGALELIELLVRAGVVASVGHTDATYAEADAAVRAGVRGATHVFNAMRPFDHREPGVLGAVLDAVDVSCELICDGVHAEPAALRLVHRAKGTAGVRLVTDATEAAGMPDGEYRLGGLRMTVLAGRATIAGGGSIAGSTLTMDAAVRNAVRVLRVGVGEAIAMASTNPARLLGLGDRKGAISVGMDADLVALDDGLFVRGTMVGGSWVVSPAV
jgi:N-acetylglucosamine-6-phosphate deacetylase